MTEEHKQYPPEAIANSILWLAQREGIPITPMKLIKLVYIVYGWYLALFDKQIFDSTKNPIEAWDHGPVIPSLYHQFKKFEARPINEFAVDGEILDHSEEIGNLRYPAVDHRDRAATGTILSVWDAYKNYNASDLRYITHAPGGAWDKAHRKGIRNERLDDEDIKSRSIEGLRRAMGKERKTRVY
ncbi:MAG TPA: hypothetical protein DDX54_07085 [Rhodospirillaceae bacterium]|jgi:uncharacterized phage-associated protein|nr:DUF4065 domain-containing protein [Alphaproteobacteria bacterium]HBH27144.1 hypothetical protein [Rhodospirillaceae bacterium]